MIDTWRRVKQPWANPHMSFTWPHMVCLYSRQLLTIIGWLGEHLWSAWSHLATMKVACLRTNTKLIFRRRESCKHCRETKAEGILTHEVTLRIMPQFKAFSSKFRSNPGWKCFFSFLFLLLYLIMLTRMEMFLMGAGPNHSCFFSLVA